MSPYLGNIQRKPGVTPKWTTLDTSPFCSQGIHMPSSGSFVTMYLAELHFGNGYMEIGLLISSLHGISIYFVMYFANSDTPLVSTVKTHGAVPWKHITSRFHQKRKWRPVSVLSWILKLVCRTFTRGANCTITPWKCTVTYEEFNKKI